MLLLNLYGVDMSTSGLIVQAQSRKKIFADKLVAFALRPNRIRNSNLWDIAWLHQEAKEKLEGTGYSAGGWFRLRQRYRLRLSQISRCIASHPAVFVA
jgi:hypothetical protein